MFLGEIPVFLVERARTVLQSREGMSGMLGKVLLTSQDTVGKRRKRFMGSTGSRVSRTSHAPAGNGDTTMGRWSTS
jgi:hypothetical protein